MVDFDDYYEEDDEYLEEYKDVKKVALYIMDAAGNIEDIIIDLDSIRKYINNLYEKYPSAD